MSPYIYPAPKPPTAERKAIQMTQLTIEQERYGIANRQLLEVSHRLLTDLKNGHTTTEISAVTIDELLTLITLVCDEGSSHYDRLRKSVATEVLVFAERVLPDYA
jgi:hypothetical protein